MWRPFPRSTSFEYSGFGPALALGVRNRLGGIDADIEKTETNVTDESGHSGLHIDSDWKSEAAKEKERLASQERTSRPPAAAEVAANFVELVNLMAMQAAIGLGGYQGPGGERIPPNPIVAKHHIDLLEVLEKKTAGNLTEEEKRILDGVLYELRLQYVQTVSAPRGGAPKAK